MSESDEKVIGRWDTVVYEKTTCNKCREVERILTEAGLSHEVVLYYENPLSKETIKSLLTKLKMEARGIMRTGEAIYKELRLEEKDLSEDELINLMIEHPDLMQRPIIEKGDSAIIGRPPESIKDFLGL